MPTATFLVRDQDDLRPIAAVVDERVMQPAERRAGIHRNVVDALRLPDVDDEVGSVV